MKRAIQLLAILLLVQAALAAIAFVSRPDVSGAPERSAFAPLNSDAVDAVTIRNGEGDEVTLERGDDGWTVGPYPAQTSAVENLLSQLTGIRAGFPAATSKDAAERFGVAKNAFKREIALSTEGDAKTRLYFGEGAGADRSYARRAGSREIYAVGVGQHAMPATSGEWQDKTLLRFNAEDARAVHLGDFTVRRAQTKDTRNASDTTSGDGAQTEGKQAAKSESDAKTGGNAQNGGAKQPEADDPASPEQSAPQWQAESVASENTFERDKFENALQSLARGRFARATREPPRDGLKDAEPSWTATVELKDAERVYRLYAPGEEGTGDPVLTVSSRPDDYFVLEQRTADTLTQDLTRDALVTTPEEAKKQEQQNRQPQGGGSRREALREAMRQRGMPAPGQQPSSAPARQPNAGNNAGSGNGASE